MPIASTTEELNQLMLKEIFTAMNSNNKGLIDLIKEQIDETVYHAYTPNYYQRSNELKTTLHQQSCGIFGNSVYQVINHDYGNWKSVVYGNGYNEVPETVSTGNYGRFVGEGYNKEYVCITGGRYEAARPYMDEFAGNSARINEYLKMVATTCGGVLV